MSIANALQSLRLEFHKSKRNHTLMMILALVLLNLVYLFMGMENTSSAHLAQPWQSILFYIPLLNTLFLPVLMAIIASRTMDLEHRGNTWNLLQTLQSRQSIFIGKTLYGLFWMIVFCLIQTTAIILLGKHYSFQGWPPIRGVFFTLLGEVIAGMVIYQIQCLLSLLLSNQFAALSINLCGTLAGFFMMYVNDKVTIPWTLLPALRVININNLEGLEYITYEWYTPPTSSYLIAIFYLIISFAVGLFLYLRLEEGTLSGIDTNVQKSSSIHTRMPAECIKLRRSPVWIAFLVLPIISALIGTFNFTQNQGVLSFTWEALWTQHSLFLGLFFLSPLIGIFCSLLWRMEHTGANWNLSLSLASPVKLIKDKFLVASGMSTLCMLWIGVLYLICGKVVGLQEPIPPMFYTCILCGILGCASIAAIQTFLSLVIHSFALPIGISLIGSIVGILCVVKGKVYALPYAMLQFGLRSTTMDWQVNVPMFILVSVLYILTLFGLSVFYLYHSDVRTHE